MSTAAALALARLAKRYAVTQRELLERLILEADKSVTDGMDADSEDSQRHFGKQTQQGRRRPHRVSTLAGAP